MVGMPSVSSQSAGLYSQLRPPTKKKRPFQCLWKDGRSEIISLTLVRLEIYKNPFATFFTLKKSNIRVILGTLRPLSLKRPKGQLKHPKNWEKVGTGKR